MSSIRTENGYLVVAKGPFTVMVEIGENGDYITQYITPAQARQIGETLLEIATLFELDTASLADLLEAKGGDDE